MYDSRASADFQYFLMFVQLCLIIRFLLLAPVAFLQGIFDTTAIKALYSNSHIDEVQNSLVLGNRQQALLLQGRKITVQTRA